MDINATNLRALYTSISTIFNKRFAEVPTYYKHVAMTVPSTTAANVYPRMDQFSGVREWLGDRIINNLSAQAYTIENRTFENTIGISRDQIEDDQVGFFSSVVAQFAEDAASVYDKLIFDLLKQGDKVTCYDKQYFFDTDHPGYDDNGKEVSVSNFTKGDKPAWYLIDNTKVIQPMVLQKRKEFKLVAKDQETDDNVFNRGQFLYGVDGRCNAGFGLYQLAHKATVELTPENYANVRAAMTSIRKRDGSIVNITPNKLLVPPCLEAEARKLLSADMINGGETNIWKNTAEPIVIPLLA